MLSLSASVVGALSVCAYFFYKLDHARHVETLAALAQRRVTGPPGGAAPADGAEPSGELGAPRPAAPERSTP